MKNVSTLMSHIKQVTECHASIRNPGWSDELFPCSKVKASTPHVWLIHVGIIPRNMCIIIIIKSVCENLASTPPTLEEGWRKLHTFGLTRGADEVMSRGTTRGDVR